jgi:hypothetical protein
MADQMIRRYDDQLMRFVPLGSDVILGVKSVEKNKEKYQKAKTLNAKKGVCAILLWSV